MTGQQDGRSGRPLAPQSAAAIGEHDHPGAGGDRRAHAVDDRFEGETAAWAYVLDDFEGGTPSALGIIADAAEAAGAPAD